MANSLGTDGAAACRGVPDSGGWSYNYVPLPGYMNSLLRSYESKEAVFVSTAGKFFNSSNVVIAWGHVVK